MMPLASSALTRRKQAEGDSETASARSTLAMRPSIIAWGALLGLSAIFAIVFAALGRKVPGAAGAAGYAAAGLGGRAATMTRWCFLVGVVSGAPIVCLIGASYVTALTGGGPLARGAVAAGLLLAVLGLAPRGVRARTPAPVL